MKVPFLDLSPIHESLKEELEAVYRTVLSESSYVKGRQVGEFEDAFAARMGTKHCTAVGNCTDALYITLKMLGIGSGDEVLVPAMTWITDAEVVSETGATPVFVDIDQEDHTIDLNQLELKVTDKTKAVIPVHIYGKMANMPAILAFAKQHGLKVIEDCAQAHLAESNGRMAGSFGHASVFSFYPTKNLGALGDAGCILTNDDALALKCRQFANHGGVKKNEHAFPGINSRMDTLQAAILLLKLNHIEDWTKSRQKLANVYSETLKGIGDLKLPHLSHGNAHVFHIYLIQTSQRDTLKNYLEEHGVQTQVHYPKAIPFTQAYSSLNAVSSDFPNAYRLQERCLSLPIFPGLSEGQQTHVISMIKEFFQDKA